MDPVAVLSRFLLGTIAVLVAVCTLGPSPVSAHERREVGKYLVVVGFNEEPALQGEPNGAQITISVPSEGDRRVEGLADSLQLTVAAGGGQPREFPLRSVFGQPGRYVADLIPTRAGAYIFNFSGSIEGMPINERFESGPGRFDEVKAVETMQFPEPVPPGNEVARIARGANERAVAAEDLAEDARRLAILGVGVGVLGIIVALGAIGLLIARRPASVASRAG